MKCPLWCLAVGTVVGECGVAHLSHRTRTSCPSESAEGAQSVTAEKLGTAPGVAVASSLKWGGRTEIPLVITWHLVGTQQAHRNSGPHTHQERTVSHHLPEGVAHMRMVRYDVDIVMSS